jgi:hypothetical protein
VVKYFVNGFVAFGEVLGNSGPWVLKVKAALHALVRNGLGCWTRRVVGKWFYEQGFCSGG